MDYTKVNLEEWKRKDLFAFYMKDMRIVMSLSIDIDVTEILILLRKII